MPAIENYISANKNACANNCICFYLWQERPFSDTLKGIADHVREFHYCDPDSMVDAVKSVLQTMTTADGVNAFIREYKKTYARPFYKTVKAFIAGEYEIPGLTALMIADIVKSKLEV